MYVIIKSSCAVLNRLARCVLVYPRAYALADNWEDAWEKLNRHAGCTYAVDTASDYVFSPDGKLYYNASDYYRRWREFHAACDKNARVQRLIHAQKDFPEHVSECSFDSLFVAVPEPPPANLEVKLSPVDGFTFFGGYGHPRT